MTFSEDTRTFQSSRPIFAERPPSRFDRRPGENETLRTAWCVLSTFLQLLYWMVSKYVTYSVSHCLYPHYVFWCIHWYPVESYRNCLHWLLWLSKYWNQNDHSQSGSRLIGPPHSDHCMHLLIFQRKQQRLFKLYDCPLTWLKNAAL